MQKRYIYPLFLLPFATFSQTVNTGDLSVKPDTEVATYFDFLNQQSGNVLNDGDFYFYGNYQNEGLFSYSTNSTTGYVVFEGLMNGVQRISGNSPSSFYDVLFNKAAEAHAFHLTNDIENAGTVNLANGVVLMDKENGGAFVFLKGAHHINTSDNSYVEGEVTKVGNESFSYPIGDAGYYRFAGISAPVNVAETYTGEYIFENPDNLYPHASRAGIIEEINDKEYWVINQITPTENSVLITLSWDERITPPSLTTNMGSALHIVRWDEDQQLWVDQGGVVDYAARTVTTPIQVDDFGVFTLGKIKEEHLNLGDVVIYQGVTPDGDGLNDYFIIDNIEQFPNNHVSIYNRWGRKVYETQSYNSRGNVFRGYAEGNGVVGRGEMLPTGTYYYIVEYLFDRDGKSQWVKKVGHLHLESND